MFWVIFLVLLLKVRQKQQWKRKHKHKIQFLFANVWVRLFVYININIHYLRAHEQLFFLSFFRWVNVRVFLKTFFFVCVRKIYTKWHTSTHNKKKWSGIMLPLWWYDKSFTLQMSTKQTLKNNLLMLIDSDSNYFIILMDGNLMAIFVKFIFVLSYTVQYVYMNTRN